MTGEIRAGSIGVGNVSDNDRVEGDLLSEIGKGGLGSKGTEFRGGVVLELAT